MADTCAMLAAAMLLGVAGFQVAAACGARVGRFTQGGRHKRSLPRSGRVVAAVSALLLVGMAAVVAGKVGRGPAADLADGLLNVLWWVTVVYLGLGVAMNLASRSRSERMVFAPVTIVVLVLVILSTL